MQSIVNVVLLLLLLLLVAIIEYFSHSLLLAWDSRCNLTEEYDLTRLFTQSKTSIY